MVIRNLIIRGIIIFLFFTLSAAIAHSSSLHIHFIDIGDGDSTLLVHPSGDNILIDVGGPLSGDRVTQYLKSLGIKRIDHLIFTHPHDDHIGGIFCLLSGFEVINFYDNGISNFESGIYEDYVSVVRQDLSRYRILQAGESLNFDDVRIDVINPVFPPTGNHNADSIAMMITYGDIKVLLTADITFLTERRLLNLGVDLKSHVLKVAHHGENDSTSEDFLKSVKPDVAIISVSKSDRYGRPHPAVLKRLTEAGARIYRTDHDGTIVLETDGKKYSIKEFEDKR